MRYKNITEFKEDAKALGYSVKKLRYINIGGEPAYSVSYGSNSIKLPKSECLDMNSIFHIQDSLNR